MMGALAIKLRRVVPSDAYVGLFPKHNVFSGSQAQDYAKDTPSGSDLGSRYQSVYVEGTFGVRVSHRAMYCQHSKLFRYLDSSGRLTWQTGTAFNPFRTAE